MTARRSGRCRAATAAAAVFACAAGFASAAPAPVYKCLDRNLGINYTDIPCKDGERLDIRAGDPDPAAIAQLARERDALDRSAAQRIADERHAALQRRYYVDPGPAYWAPDGAYAEAPIYSNDYVFGYGYGYPYGGVWTPDRRRSADARGDRPDRRGERSRVVPAHPATPHR